MNELSFRVVQEAACTIVHARGEIDLATAPHLLEVVSRLSGSVVVDLADVGYLDSSGMHALDGANRKLRQNGGGVALRNPQPYVRRVLEIIGFRDWIEA